jgi:hypothetical protein
MGASVNLSHERKQSRSSNGDEGKEIDHAYENQIQCTLQLNKIYRSGQPKGSHLDSCELNELFEQKRELFDNDFSDRIEQVLLKFNSMEQSSSAQPSTAHSRSSSGQSDSGLITPSISTLPGMLFMAQAGNSASSSAAPPPGPPPLRSVIEHGGTFGKRHIFSSPEVGALTQ